MPSQPPGIRRITLVVDVEGYSRRPAPDQIDIQRRLVLDSMALRAALRDRQDSDLALIVTDDLYTGVVASGYAGLSADGFSNVVIDIPENRFHASAWILVPGQPPHAAGRRSRINDPLPPAVDFKTVFPFVAAAAAGGTIGAVAEHINHTHDPAAPDHGAHSAGHGTHGHGHGPHGLGHGTHGPGHGAHDPGGHGHAGDGGGYHG